MNIFYVCFRTDGYIVCEEHEDVLRAAWVEEQELQKQKEKEVSVFVCVYFDLIWQLLIRGLLTFCDLA